MDYIDHNFDWLEEKLATLQGAGDSVVPRGEPEDTHSYPDKYLLFDFPGQVELYTHEKSVHNILQKLQKLGYKVSSGYFPLSAGYNVLIILNSSSPLCISWMHTTAQTAPSSSQWCC